MLYRENIISTIASDILQKIPDPFDIHFIQKVTTGNNKMNYSYHIDLEPNQHDSIIRCTPSRIGAMELPCHYHEIIFAELTEGFDR
jgi:hypothetical protein